MFKAHVPEFQFRERASRKHLKWCLGLKVSSSLLLERFVPVHAGRRLCASSRQCRAEFIHRYEQNLIN